MSTHAWVVVCSVCLLLGFLLGCALSEGCGHNDD